jgi:hypothetical protein
LELKLPVSGILVFVVYVPTGKAVYINCLSEFSETTQKWALDAYIDPPGTGELFAGSFTPIPFNYLLDAWQAVRIISMKEVMFKSLENLLN